MYVIVASLSQELLAQEYLYATYLLLKYLHLPKSANRLFPSNGNHVLLFSNVSN